MNHVESECFTKKRDEGKKGKSNKTKADEAEEPDGWASVSHIKVKLAGDSKGKKRAVSNTILQPTSHYQQAPPAPRYMYEMSISGSWHMIKVCPIVKR